MSDFSSAFTPANLKKLFSLPVIVAALGYFVDIYDLLLFGIVRVPSLKSLGLNEQQVSSVGVAILNWQMGGLLVGGILWGVLGDKKGRLSVLFGSIITYSVANIACGFIQDTAFLPATELYKYLRFVAGVGLAGELGAGITLVSEILPKHLRGYGSSIVASVGLFAPVVVFFTVKQFDWRTTYFIGGGLGLLLLLLRVSVFESGMYEKAKTETVNRGNFFAFFTNRARFLKYIRCMGISVPTYLCIGLLATFGNEFGQAMGISGIVPGQCVMYLYLGTVLGDIFSAFLSQALRSRRQAIGIMMFMTLLSCGYYLFGGITSANVFYATIGIMGFSIGFIAMFLTVSAEHFGTNLRATATTSIANNVRATTLLTIPAFQMLKPVYGVINAGAMVAVVCFLVGFISVITMEETFGKDLDYTE